MAFIEFEFFLEQLNGTVTLEFATIDQISWFPLCLSHVSFLLIIDFKTSFLFQIFKLRTSCLFHKMLIWSSLLLSVLPRLSSFLLVRSNKHINSNCWVASISEVRKHLSILRTTHLSAAYWVGSNYHWFRISLNWSPY